MKKHIIQYESLKLEKLLGKGMFGSVFRGKMNEEEVAIKKIPQNQEDQVEPMASWEDDTYFRREVEILSSLVHPNVLKFKGISYHDNTLYIITEYAEGGDLRNYLKQNQPTWPQRIKISTQVAEAIAYLHSRNIVHRDVKTENVLMDKDLDVKLCDFGFAREVNSTKSPGNYTFCGSEFFEAPEIMFCMDYDERVDTFSYGLVLCEIISRKQPSAAVFKRVIPGFGVDQREILSLAEDGCPESLLAAAMNCCKDTPDERPELENLIEEFKEVYFEMTGEKMKETVQENEKKNETPQDLMLSSQRLIVSLRSSTASLRIQAPVTASSVENLFSIDESPEKSKREPEQQKKVEEMERVFYYVNQEKIIKYLESSSWDLEKAINLCHQENVVAAEPRVSSELATPAPKEEKKSFMGDFLKSKKKEIPDIIRVGRLKLASKNQAKDKDIWINFMKAVNSKMIVVDHQVTIKKRHVTFRKCFTGQDVVDCFLSIHKELTRKQGTELGQIVINLGLIYTIDIGKSKKTKNFKDDQTLYRFVSDRRSEDKHDPRPVSFV